LHFLAGAHAARADDALRRIEREIRVARVLRRVEVILAGVAVAHLAQADGARHVLQLAVAVRRARQTIERMVGDVELHDVAPHLRDLRVLRRDLHALADLGRARRRHAAHALDLDEAEPARAERREAVRGAQLRNIDVGHGRGAQHGRAGRHADLVAVDRERDGFGRGARRRPEVGRALVGLENCAHRNSPFASYAVAFKGRALRSSGKWFNTLSTGNGAMPPSAHSEPATIVSQSSRNSLRLPVSFSPRLILSMTSTPRTAPMRHGVHLPQDSMAQNSMANRACSPMSTVSSNTT